MSIDLTTASAVEIAQAVRGGQITAATVAEQTLARIAATHGQLNAFTTATAGRARAEAAAVDAALAVGSDPGPLAGVPYAVKNLFDLAGVVTLAGSKINRANLPARGDATAVDRLRRAGAVCVGALNMGEYAYDFVTDNAHDGATHNPHDLARSPGGSSGGSGAAVAGGLVPLTLGSDTNGSIRVPASFCGIWGLKPTYGRLSRAGSFPFVASLDHVGPLARSVNDLALAYDALQGPDLEDPVCTRRSAEPVSALLDAGIAGLRIAVLGGYFEQRATRPALDAVAMVASALGVNRRVELPEVVRARAAAYVITAAESGQFHLERLRRQADDFDPQVRDRLLAGAMLPGAWYMQAQRFRTWYRERVREIFQEVDVLLAPATPVPATLIGQDMMTLDGAELPVRPNLGIFTQPISFIGLPVVAAPVSGPGRLPIAVQVIAAPWHEASALRVAHVLERAGVCRALITVPAQQAA